MNKHSLALKTREKYEVLVSPHDAHKQLAALCQLRGHWCCLNLEHFTAAPEAEGRDKGFLCALKCTVQLLTCVCAVSES